MVLAGMEGLGRLALVSSNNRPEMNKMDVQKLLNLGELAGVLGRSPETIKKDMRRNPDAVPPRLQLPGTRLLRWRARDVDAWLGQYVQAEGGRHD